MKREREIGQNKERKEFVDLLNCIEQNGFDTIILYSLERIFRDMLTLLCLEKLLDEYDIELHTVEAEIDTSTPDGSVSLAIRSFPGEMERRQVRHRTKNAMEYKKEKGEVVGQVHWEYKREKRNLIIDEKEQEVTKVVNGLY